MSLNNTEIRVTQNGFSYSPRPFGRHAGVPTVAMKLSSSDEQGQRIGAIKSQMETWGWHSRIRSGFARLMITGNDPLADEHAEAIQTFYDIVSPTFLDIEVGPNYLTQEPLRSVNNAVDSYSIYVPEDRKFNEDALEFFAEQSRSFGNAEFLFKVDRWNIDEYVNEISREYQIYDSDIYLYPVGWKPNTVAENYEICESLAKTNSWNVSPRLDVFRDYEPEDEDAESN